MSSGHARALPAQGNERRLAAALALTATFLAVEVAGSVITGSLALLSDAAHMLTDAAALAIALTATRLGRRPADARRTWGYARFEILAAAFNALLLVAVAAYILVEAVQRLRAPAPIAPMGMLAVATVGLIVNYASLRLLATGREASLNVRGAYLEVWSDLLGSAGVIAAAITIRATGWQWVDSVVAVAIGLWVLPRTWGLLRETTNILLEGVPAGIDLAAIEAALARHPGVQGVHDLHVWAITSGQSSLSAHVVHTGRADAEPLLRALHDRLVRDFAIDHVTLQLERSDCRLDPPGPAADAPPRP